MRLPIRTARHLHSVSTVEELAEKHRAALADRAKRTRDPSIQAVVADRPLVVRINDGCWLGDCDCGAGVGVEPSWPSAYCFGCGAIYTAIVLPDEYARLNIEYVLAPRRRMNQHWTPGETLLGLALENAEHGVRF